MCAQLNFDATTVAPQTVMAPIPSGWYDVRITESEMKPTKDGTGTRLALTLEVIGGQYNNRKLFEGLNLRNNNPQTVEIAYAQLSAICHACGVLQLQDSQQLHNVPFRVKVAIRKDPTGQYEPQNQIKAYMPANYTENGVDPVARTAAENASANPQAGGGFAPQGGGFAPPQAMGGFAPPQQHPAQGGFAPQQPQGYAQPQQQPQQPQGYAPPQGGGFAPQGQPQQPVQQPPQQAGQWAQGGQQPWAQPGQQQPPVQQPPVQQPPQQPQAPAEQPQQPQPVQNPYAQAAGANPPWNTAG